MNKTRENLLPVFSWIWKQDLLETLSRFPPPREQRDVASFHDLTKSEINPYSHCELARFATPACRTGAVENLVEDQPASHPRPKN